MTLRCFNDPYSNKSPDLTLLVENSEFGVHREVLEANSRYFTAMFNGMYEEASKCEIKLGGVDRVGVECCLQIVYGEAADVNEQNIVGLLVAANMLQFDNALHQAYIFLANLLGKPIDRLLYVPEVVQLYDVIRTQSIEEDPNSKDGFTIDTLSALKVLRKAIRTHFISYATSSAFDNVSAECLIDILGDEKLGVDRNEYIAVQGAMNWLNANPIVGRDHIPRLFNKLYLSLLSGEQQNQLLKEPNLVDHRGLLDCRLKLPSWPRKTHLQVNLQFPDLQHIVGMDLTNNTLFEIPTYTQSGYYCLPMTSVYTSKKRAYVPYIVAMANGENAQLSPLKIAYYARFTNTWKEIHTMSDSLDDLRIHGEQVNLNSDHVLSIFGVTDAILLLVSLKEFQGDDAAWLVEFNTAHHKWSVHGKLFTTTSGRFGVSIDTPISFDTPHVASDGRNDRAFLIDKTGCFSTLYLRNNVPHKVAMRTTAPKPFMNKESSQLSVALMNTDAVVLYQMDIANPPELYLYSLTNDVWEKCNTDIAVAKHLTKEEGASTNSHYRLLRTANGVEVIAVNGILSSGVPIYDVLCYRLDVKLLTLLPPKIITPHEEFHRYVTHSFNTDEIHEIHTANPVTIYPNVCKLLQMTTTPHAL